MFKLSIGLVALALSGTLSLAIPTKRAPALEVSLSAPAEVHSIDDLKVTANVTNTGSAPLKVLKYGTVLDNELSTRSFTVTKDGTAADFTGIKIQLDMSAVDDSSYVVIPAGETVVVEHDVAPLYNFEALGTGAFEFEPTTTFQVIEADATRKPSAHIISAKKATVTVTSDVKKRDLKAIEKRAVVYCSNSSFSSFILASFTEGTSLAGLAVSYIDAFGADPLYESYFGTASTNAVRNVLLAVASESSKSRTLNCSDPYGFCTNGVIAYTLTSTTNIYYCPIFFNEVATDRLCSDTTVASRNVRGGTILHELTHATSGTIDVGYGCDFDMSLGQTNPELAVINADNYNCFATQVYQNTQC